MVESVGWSLQNRNFVIVLLGSAKRKLHLRIFDLRVVAVPLQRQYRVIVYG